jgi:trans-aconitate 2-methyltransferase
MDTWNPTQYDKFLREREQPFFDLLALIQPVPDMHVVDLGCGTGKLTRVLHNTLQAPHTIGIDRSERMLHVAKSNGALPGLRFELGEIEAFAAEAEYDLIFSNAAFQWVREHEELISCLFAALKPGGQLAFQLSAMDDNPSHTVAEALTTEPPFRSAFLDWRSPLRSSTPEEYSRLLHRSGFAQQHVRLAIYPHQLPSRWDVIEWMKGSLLTAYEKRLTPGQFETFLAEYGRRLIPELDSEQPFFFPFKRILCWARRSG